MSLRLNAEGATQAWDDLAARLERFIATWDSDREIEPTLVDFLPPEPPTHRRLVLVELIKVDLEQRTARGKQRRLEEYSAEFPELLENGEPPCDLIYEEYHICRGAGQDVSLSDYCQRFPKSAPALKRLMGTEGPSTSTQLFNPSRRIAGIAVGERLDDFDLLAEVGKGSFGIVFLARQVSLGRLVALKVSADKGHEPRTLAALDHPNIVRVFDQRRLADKRVLLFYMVYAPGGTLAEVVRLVRDTLPASRNGSILIRCVTEAMEKAGQIASEDSPWRRRVGAMSWPETVCRLGAALAGALDYAHRQGILHRDVKPANVLLSAEGSPKLADFNISFSSQIEGATPAAYFGGSIAYMSPEQLEACNPNHERKPDELDGRSDLYALGVLLWELLHGERPFADEDIGGWSASLDAMSAMRCTEPPWTPLGASRDAVTIRIEHVLRKVLSPDPAKRQPDGATLARELLLCLNPRAWDLVNDLGSGWRNWARRLPILALFPINLPPFLLASWFNLKFNDDAFIRHQSAEIQRAFDRLVPPVNLTLFPIAIFLVLAFAWPVASALHRLNAKQPCTPDQLRRARSRSITLGYWIAAVGLTFWIVAGIAFPVGIDLQTDFPASGYVHFFLSMLTCGLISCAFPFLATTWLTLRVNFPALLGSTVPEPGEQRRLASLGRAASVFLGMAVIVPLFGLLLALWAGREETRIYATLLILASVILFVGAYFMYHRIRADLVALSVATRPGDMLGAATDSVEAF
jgi:serine/threonine protein kinase